MHGEAYKNSVRERETPFSTEKEKIRSRFDRLFLHSHESVNSIRNFLCLIDHCRHVRRKSETNETRTRRRHCWLLVCFFIGLIEDIVHIAHIAFVYRETRTICIQHSRIVLIIQLAKTQPRRMNEFHLVFVKLPMRRTAYPWRWSAMRGRRKCEQRIRNGWLFTCYRFHGTAWVCVICFETSSTNCSFARSSIASRVLRAMHLILFFSSAVLFRSADLGRIHCPSTVSLDFLFHTMVHRLLVVVTAWAPNDKGLSRYNLYRPHRH